MRRVRVTLQRTGAATSVKQGQYTETLKRIRGNQLGRTRTGAGVDHGSEERCASHSANRRRKEFAIVSTANIGDRDNSSIPIDWGCA